MVDDKNIPSSKKLIFFITFLRALAACFITNAHYTGIYPTDMIANGGLIGDVLFFAVSGYCLYNVKNELSLRGFVGWYGKRIWRVYPPVLIITAVYMLLGAFSLHDHSITWWYIYPTNYHFVASIIVLYVPFFFIMKISWLRDRIISIMISISVIWLVIYSIFYDKTYYHIDSVYEPMIRFLFMESMLLGAYFRQNDKQLRDQFKLMYPIITIIAFLVYFASKLVFSRKEAYSSFQFLNQIAIFVLLVFMFKTFCGLDNRLEKMPDVIRRIIKFVSDMTLEIYVVQKVIIGVVRNRSIAFPLNWLLLTMIIIITAFALHMVCNYIYKGVDKLLWCKRQETST